MSFFNGSLRLVERCVSSDEGFGPTLANLGIGIVSGGIHSSGMLAEHALLLVLLTCVAAGSGNAALLFEDRHTVADGEETVKSGVQSA